MEYNRIIIVTVNKIENWRLNKKIYTRTDWFVTYN